MQAEFEPVQQSFVSWVFMALGIKYTLLLPLVAFVCFVLTLIVVVRGKGSMAGTALLLIVPIPILIGVFAAGEGMMTSYAVIAASPTTPKPSELAAGYSMALVAPLVSLLLSAPSYGLAALGSFMRSLTDNSGKAAQG